MTEIKQQQPTLLEYNLDSNVRAFSTTRNGGCSIGKFGEMNINPFCGDNLKTVVRNREALCQKLNICSENLILPHQTHETNVAVIDKKFLSLPSYIQKIKLEGIDALTTDIAGVCIGVSTADCIPILLYDKVSKSVCAIHAGWRGTVKRIVASALQTMRQQYGTETQNIVAQIAPGISLNNFEVGDEVYETFLNSRFDMPPISKHLKKWHINLPECNRRQLIDEGVLAENISVSDICTYEHADTFFSARKLGTASGRIFSGIMIK